jgi:hypothetical protein
VSPAVVDDHDVAAPQGWTQTLFQIGQKHLSIHGPLQHHRRNHFVVPHCCSEGDCFPGSKRNATNHFHTSRSVPSETHHAGRYSSFIEKHELGRVEQALLSDPTSARSGHVCSLSFGSLQAFFKAEVVSVKKTRERAAAGPNAVPSEFSNSFFQDQTRLLCNHHHHSFRLLFQWRNATSARLRRGAPAPFPALHRLDY